MIERGIIRKMGQYYQNSPQYREEISRGMREFFDNDIPYDDEPLFNEWLMYDFIFGDGKRMLEKFYYENPLSIPEYRREIYKTLLENYYGWYEVLEVMPLEGLALKRLSDNKTFNVSEVSATMDLGIGDIFVARVAKAVDHYELVGADTKVIKSSQSKSEKERKMFLKEMSLFKMNTPKDAFHFFNLYSQI